MNSVADVLASEGQRTPLPLGSAFRLGRDGEEDVRVIVRHGPEGAHALLADRERFPLLFELADASRAEAPVTEEQWRAAATLAHEADLAAGR